MIATTSALGRSSIYNRLRYRSRPLMFPVGYTSGWGEFHFTNGAYSQLRKLRGKLLRENSQARIMGVGFRIAGKSFGASWLT